MAPRFSTDEISAVLSNICKSWLPAALFLPVFIAGSPPHCCLCYAISTPVCILQTAVKCPACPSIVATVVSGNLCCFLRVNLRYTIGILGWGSGFPLAFSPSLQIVSVSSFTARLKTSSSQSQFVFHPDNKLNSWEAVKFFPLPLPVPVHHGTVDPTELHCAPIPVCLSPVLSEIS